MSDSTTDTVTQEWMEACKAEPIDNKRSQYGGYYPNAPIGIIDIVDGKRVFTPLVVDKPIRTPRKEIVVTQSDSSHGNPYGEWTAVAIFLAMLAIVWITLITIL